MDMVLFYEPNYRSSLKGMHIFWGCQREQAAAASPDLPFSQILPENLATAYKTKIEAL